MTREYRATLKILLTMVLLGWIISWIAIKGLTYWNFVKGWLHERILEREFEKPKWKIMGIMKERRKVYNWTETRLRLKFGSERIYLALVWVGAKSL